MQTQESIIESRNLRASTHPLTDIEKVSYMGQDPRLKKYRAGYESYFNQLPVLDDHDPFITSKVHLSNDILNQLSSDIKEEAWIKQNHPGPMGFERTILALESPIPSGYQGFDYKEGKELIVAKWGDGFTSPVHGHAMGFMYEQLIYGKMRVNTYRLHSEKTGTVRPIMTRIYKGFTNIANAYTPFVYVRMHQRRALIHNFTSVGESVSLHYVPEHTRDGRDNQFSVQYFEDAFALSEHDVDQADPYQAIYSQLGDVYLVRSANVPEYGDHFIVITGRPVSKPHGIRPKDEAIHAPHTGHILDNFKPINGVTLLKLTPTARKAFFSFHEIGVEEGGIIFPQP
jgi:hypothetical protein